jgi:hypothetical protein
MKFIETLIFITSLSFSTYSVLSAPIIDESAVSYEGYTVYRFAVRNAQDVKLLKRLTDDPDLGVTAWSHGIHVGNVDLSFSPEAKESLSESVLGAVPNQILISNVEDLIHAGKQRKYLQFPAVF